MQRSHTPPPDCEHALPIEQDIRVRQAVAAGQQATTTPEKLRAMEMLADIHTEHLADAQRRLEELEARANAMEKNLPDLMQSAMRRAMQGLFNEAVDTTSKGLFLWIMKMLWELALRVGGAGLLGFLLVLALGPKDALVVLKNLLLGGPTP